MENKSSFKKIILIILAVFLFFIVMMFMLLGILNKKPVAAFYGISEENKTSICEVLQKTAVRRNGKSAPYEIVVLDDSIDLNLAIKKTKKPDLLFINRGKNLDFATSISEKKDTGIPNNEIWNGFTTSIKKICPLYTKKNEIVKLSAIPLLIDNLEIDINYQCFLKSKIKSINTLNDLDKVAKANKKAIYAPILFAGGEATSFIDTFGALVEAIEGVDTWNKLVSDINRFQTTEKVSSTTLYDFLSPMFNKGGYLYNTLATIQNWKDSGLLPSNFAQLTNKDLKAYANAELVSILFITLSEHRTYDRNVIKNYTSIYYPSNNVNMKRSFTAPIIMAVPMKKNKTIRNSVKLLATTYQDNLSSKTGLAPVQANCSIPDKQADDARYWIAASEAPLPTLSNACFTNASTKAAFADAIKSFIK